VEIETTVHVPRLYSPISTEDVIPFTDNEDRQYKELRGIAISPIQSVDMPDDVKSGEGAIFEKKGGNKRKAEDIKGLKVEFL
jgi:hypothetical protein